MAAPSEATAEAESAAQASWLPMLIIALAQIQMAFNVGGLPVWRHDSLGRHGSFSGVNWYV